MTTKTDAKTPPKQSASMPSQQEVQAAYQCHTLAQVLYGQIAAKMGGKAPKPVG